jgi:hypothetical protein
LPLVGKVKKAQAMTKTLLLRCFLVSFFILWANDLTLGQRMSQDEEFGPVVRAYLGYLRNEQDVVDDRASRNEVTAAYYRRNSNRISSLRQMAMRIARESHNDYLPELESVTGGELGLLFERPPRSESLRVGEVFQATFRYLGYVRAGELFHVFARLDPYEQSEWMEKTNHNPNNAESFAVPVTSEPKVMTRVRRVTTPN